MGSADASVRRTAGRQERPLTQWLVPPQDREGSHVRIPVRCLPVHSRWSEAFLAMFAFQSVCGVETL